MKGDEKYEADKIRKYVNEQSRFSWYQVLAVIFLVFMMACFGFFIYSIGSSYQGSIEIEREMFKEICTRKNWSYERSPLSNYGECWRIEDGVKEARYCWDNSLGLKRCLR